MGKRIIARRRGSGSAVYRSPSHRHKGEAGLPDLQEGTGVVEDIVHAPGRSTPLMRVKLDTGKVSNQIANEGAFIGQKVVFSKTRPDIASGNTSIVGEIPEGTPVFNLEGTPGDGGKFVRAGGNAGYVVSHGPDGTVVLLPSGKMKVFPNASRATIGIAAGGGMGDKPFLKAGKRAHKEKNRAKNWPKVRGVAMNPVDHPHGGGSHNYTGRPTSVGRGSPPGSKVGKISPKRTGKR
ncbi:MAG: 50S ribosomal protein L2 [Euryarchaeota archaeon]|nr:50S ribosomal protein L2 [Euryarchaeota archaeon]